VTIPESVAVHAIMGGMAKFDAEMNKTWSMGFDALGDLFI